MKKQILKYLLFFLVNIILLNIILYFIFFKNPKPKPPAESTIVGSLIDKLDFYKIHKKEYGLVFIGDSRTYTNINNYQIDTILKTNSINMAMWANWFPTQYCFLQDFLPTVPDSTTLVFSFGYQNFTYCKINDAYPIDYNRAKEYVNWGFSLAELKAALYYNNSNILPILPLSQTQIHGWFMEKMNNYFAVFNAKKEAILQKSEPDQKVTEETKDQTTTAVDQNSDKKIQEKSLTINKVEQLSKFYKNNSEVVEIRERKDKDTITSLEVYWKKGNYWRVELDSLYFRRKQKETSHEKTTVKMNDFADESRYWKNFEAIIGLLKKNNKRLKIILNYVDEAPYTYWSGKDIYTNFINNKLKPYIASQGFTLTTVDVSDMPDSDYFDYNHMNSKGTVKYSERLARILKEKIN